MVDYAAIQLKAQSKIIAYGSSMTLRITSKSSYNATADTYTESSTDYSVSGVRRNYSNQEISAARGLGNSLIKINDIELLISDENLPELREDDNISIIDGDSTWYPVRIQAVKPGDTVLLYKIQAAREVR